MIWTNIYCIKIGNDSKSIDSYVVGNFNTFLISLKNLNIEIRCIFKFDVINFKSNSFNTYHVLWYDSIDLIHLQHPFFFCLAYGFDKLALNPNPPSLLS